jgi:hypothetical protein
MAAAAQSPRTPRQTASWRPKDRRVDEDDVGHGGKVVPATISVGLWLILAELEKPLEHCVLPVVLALSVRALPCAKPVAAQSNQAVYLVLRFLQSAATRTQRAGSSQNADEPVLSADPKEIGRGADRPHRLMLRASWFARPAPASMLAAARLSRLEEHQRIVREEQDASGPRKC